jgi:hypothetical protein
VVRASRLDAGRLHAARDPVGIGDGGVQERPERHRERHGHRVPVRLAGSIRSCWNESLTEIETAAVLGVTLMSINRWVRTDRLKDHKVGGKSMIRLSEIKRILEERRPTRGRRIFLAG